MIPYRTSSDYERLQALLDAGQEIACIVDYRTRAGRVLREICRGRRTGIGQSKFYSFGVRGFAYGEVWLDTSDDFSTVCRSLNLKYIDPTLL